MFLGLVLIYLGLVVAVNTAWALVGLPVLILWLHFGVIRREERYLEDRFGDEYTSYRRRVPRWIPRVASNK
jgi:protein-S-isoprenylcysteine O-methyltransferase Ste14